MRRRLAAVALAVGGLVFAMTGVAPVNARVSEPNARAPASLASNHAIPHIRALASSGRAGSLVKLRYRVSDDGRRTREQIKIYRGDQFLRTLATRTSLSEPGVTYWFEWRAPRALVGLFRFCVTAIDPDGNQAGPSCARLQLRPPGGGGGGGPNPPPSNPDPGGCSPSYPSVCIPLPPPDLDCADVPHSDFVVLQPDPHNFDGDRDGRGCES
jgi:hypothetical protein